MMMTIVMMMMMMMMMMDRGLMKKKNPISDVSSNVFSTFSSHYTQKGNSTKGKNMNLEQNSRDSRHFR